MLRVLYALFPICISSIYLFGWRFLAVLAVSNIVGFLYEYFFARAYKQSVTSSVFVTTFFLPYLFLQQSLYGSLQSVLPSESHLERWCLGDLVKTSLILHYRAVLLSMIASGFP